jgi:hypothetical protein
MNPIPRTIGRAVRARNPRYSRLYTVVSFGPADQRERSPLEPNAFYLRMAGQRSLLSFGRRLPSLVLAGLCLDLRNLN